MSGLLGMAVLLGVVGLGAAVTTVGSWALGRSLSRPSAQERKQRRIAQMRAAQGRGEACCLCGKRWPRPTIPVVDEITGEVKGWACEEHRQQTDSFDPTRRVTDSKSLEAAAQAIDQMTHETPLGGTP